MAKRVKLNCQGLARRDRGLMECIVPDPGMEFSSIDLSAGEPTVTSHFSRDPKYLHATFDGVGKEPYYAQDGTLMIDDIYLMTMSRSPLGADIMKDAFHNTYKGVPFIDQWMDDPEVIKSMLGEARKLHKMLALALGYGMGTKKMVKQCYDAGKIISLAEAKAFHKAYWNLFNVIRKLVKYLEQVCKRDGYIINPFGYRMMPEPHKAFNYFIQSSVSSVMHLFNMYLFEQNDWLEFVTCIHDETVLTYPTDKREEAKICSQKATVKLNQALGWSVNVRTGWAPGKDMYESK